MRFPRKPALALAAVAASLLVALAVVPMLFRDRIATRLKTEIGRSVNARVSWGGSRSAFSPTSRTSGSASTASASSA